VAYIPNGYITGLSKIARVVDIFSHPPASAGTYDTANQRLYPGDTEPIGSDGGSGGKAYVYADARSRKTNSITTTSDFTGAFNQAKTREEFMNLIQHGRV